MAQYRAGRQKICVDCISPCSSSTKSSRRNHTSLFAPQPPAPLRGPQQQPELPWSSPAPNPALPHSWEVPAAAQGISWRSLCSSSSLSAVLLQLSGSHSAFAQPEIAPTFAGVVAAVVELGPSTLLSLAKASDFPVRGTAWEREQRET